jgi:UrcA family protein
MKRAIFCAALAASALMGAMTAARAEDGQMRVKVGDLNLSTPEGAQEALSRIHASATVFCEVGPGREQLERVAAENRCVTAMVQKGVDGLQAPLVSATLDARSPASPAAASVTLAAAK